jgi:hypothetical protein
MEIAGESTGSSRAGHRQGRFSAKATTGQLTVIPAAPNALPSGDVTRPASARFCTSSFEVTTVSLPDDEAAFVQAAG